MVGWRWCHSENNPPDQTDWPSTRPGSDGGRYRAGRGIASRETAVKELRRCRFDTEKGRILRKSIASERKINIVRFDIN